MEKCLEKRISDVGEVLCDPSQTLAGRFRALFTLKNIGGDEAVDWIAKAFSDTSSLLKHELAYCLGQMKNPHAISCLTNVLEDLNQEAIVRHEAGEALGAIGTPEVLPILKKYCKDSSIEVSETCELAIERIKWLNNETESKENLSVNPYESVDPAPPTPTNLSDVTNLGINLLDKNETLYQRYRAMFALRNIGSPEAVKALAKGLRCPSSALFRHEIAFVLGQLQSPLSIDELLMSLEDKDEHEMVRHESAEALGSIATPECIQALQRFASDDKRVVRESCVVALDMAEYETSTEFQYANTASKVCSKV